MGSSNNLSNNNGVEVLAGIKMVTTEMMQRVEVVGLIGGKTQEIKYGGILSCFAYMTYDLLI